MQRDLLKSRLARLDPAQQLPASFQDGDDDGNALETLREGEALDDDDVEADEGRDSFPAEPEKPRKTPRRRIGGLAASSQQYTPLSAAGLFDEALEVQATVSQLYTDSPDETEATFRVYYSPPEVGVKDGATVFVCVHGAGYSGLSFARFARSLVDSNRQPDDGDGGENTGKVGVLAYDARGHGRTRVPEPPMGSEGRLDMSLGSLADDLVRLLTAIYPNRSEAPAIVLVGHSMGGAVVSEASNRIQQEVTTVTGVVVIDVVEGTALEALPGMAALVASHPKSFESQEDAIAWHVHSRTINNLESARISVPPLLKKAEPGADQLGAENGSDYVWRLELEKTEPFWSGWFTGLSKKFLACRTAKLLLLAGTDRLDKDLLIGQMQGRYQLEVYPDVGHCVHEDAPERTAETLLSFWERNDRSDVLKGVKKVGEV